MTSNLSLTVRNLWYFACGRGNHEKTIAQLKTGLAFHSVPTQTYAANSAWQQLVVLAHNLLTNFQLETGAPRATPHPQAHGRALAAERADAPLRTVSSGRPAGPPRRQGATSNDRQPPDASDVHPASRTLSRVAEFLTH